MTQFDATVKNIKNTLLKRLQQETQSQNFDFMPDEKTTVLINKFKKNEDEC